MITLKEARKLAESFVGEDYIIVGSNEFKNGFGFYISTAFSKKMFVGATLVFVNKFTKRFRKNGFKIFFEEKEKEA